MKGESPIVTEPTAPSWTPPRRRTVVVTPHPDDESLSAAGLIQRQVGRGVEVIVVAVTDGDAAYSPEGDPELAAVRRGEQGAALGRLGVADAVRLGLPDGDVSSVENDLTDALCEIVDAGDLVVALWEHDHHPDHEAVGRAVRVAATSVGAVRASTLFWAWHRQVHDPPVPALVGLELRQNELAAKRDAIDAHRSQLAAYRDDAILDEHLLSPARWPVEYYVIDPATERSG